MADTQPDNTPPLPSPSKEKGDKKKKPTFSQLIAFLGIWLLHVILPVLVSGGIVWQSLSEPVRYNFENPAECSGPPHLLGP